MYIAIILAVALLIFIIIYGVLDGEVATGIVAGILISGVAFLFLLLIGACIADSLKYETDAKVISSEPVYAFKDNSGYEISGRFFLIAGSVSGKNKQEYRYLVDGEYGIKQESINIDDAYIKFSDDPHLEIVKVEPVDKSLFWYCYPKGDIKYIFYIPEGSVINEFEVDLE